MVFIAKDWIEDVVKFSKQSKDNQENSNTVGQLIMSNMMDVVLLCFMIVVIRYPDRLWWILLTLLVMMGIRECFQLSVSFKRYTNDWKENIIEVCAIILVAVILYNDCNLHNRNVNRNLAAFSIVLTWAELITVAARHPRLTR